MSDIDVIHAYTEMLCLAKEVGLEIDNDLAFGKIHIKEENNSQYRSFSNAEVAFAYVLGYLDKTKSRQIP